jgi:Fur family ferric uptake transcriptional regulator
MSCLHTLKSRGLRLTPQRRLIIELIHERPVCLTAEDIITYVQEHMPGVNKSTVYRTLELLEKSGCVYRSEIDNRTVFYHAEGHQHHHLVCEKCGKTLECDNKTMAPLGEELRRKYGFEAHLEHIVITGLCQECRKGSS